MIDYRSDTFTKPGPDMLRAMFSASVGDDVFAEDPSVNRLESLTAEMFNMEAGLFCPSGTMTNQIAIKVHTRAGDEVICDHLSHVYIYEGGGIAFNSGCSVKTITGNRGLVTADQVRDAINPNDIHRAPTSLVSLENTANRGGGSCYSFNELENIQNVCSEHRLGFHLDGARLFNALVAKKETPQQYGDLFDSISVCLSKGLGTPVGSVLIGNKDFIKQARRYRKVLGGGMRQAGYLAAAGIYALEHNVDRLQQDHDHAQLLASALQARHFTGNFLPVETNIIIFEVTGSYTPASLSEKLMENGIYVMPISPTQVRMVLHLDITPEMVEKTLKVINQL